MTAMVSIITPTYNRRDLLCKAIESVLQQTHRDWELIIVDDGSSDGTGEYIASLGDGRIRYEFQENRGQSAARNRGLELCEGDFVAFLDSDNEWREGRLGRHLAALARHPDYDAVYGISQRLDVRRAAQSESTAPPSGYITRQLLQRNWIPFNSVLLRRSLVEKTGGFDETLRSAEDYDFWLRASLHGKFLYDPEVSTFYYLTPGSISTDLEKNFESNERILRRFFQAHPEFSDWQQRARTWSTFYQGTSAQWSGARAHKEAIRDALRALAAAPWRPSGYGQLARRLLNAVRRPART